MVDAPVLLNAPAAVNKAKLDVAPKLGAVVCPKLTVDVNNKTTVVIIKIISFHFKLDV